MLIGCGARYGREFRYPGCDIILLCLHAFDSVAVDDYAYHGVDSVNNRVIKEPHAATLGSSQKVRNVFF